MTKHTDEFLQFAEPVTCREFLYHEMTNKLARKVGFKGIPNFEILTRMCRERGNRGTYQV